MTNYIEPFVNAIVTYFDSKNKITVTATIKELKKENGKERAILTHKGKFKHYFDVNIGCFAITVQP